MQYVKKMSPSCGGRLKGYFFLTQVLTKSHCYVQDKIKDKSRGIVLFIVGCVNSRREKAAKFKNTNFIVSRHLLVFQSRTLNIGYKL